MSEDKNKQESRRKVLKSTLAGGAIVSTSILPDKWAKPVMDSVVIPAHAQMSPTSGGDDDGSGDGASGTTSAPTTVAPTTPFQNTTTTTTTTTTSTTAPPSTQAPMNVETGSILSSDILIG